MIRSRVHLSLVAGSALLLVLVGAAVNHAAKADDPRGAPAFDLESFAHDPVPEGAVARLGTLRLRQFGGASCVAFSPDGNSLASADDAGVHLWEVATGRELRCFSNATEVLAVSFSASGNSIIAATKDCTLQYWEILSGEVVRETKRKFKIETFIDANGASHLIRADIAVFSSGGEACLFGRDKAHFWICDATACMRGNRIAAPGLLVQAMALAADGKALALIACADKGDDEKAELVLCDGSTGEESRKFPAAEARSDRWAAFAPDGKSLVTLGDKSLHLWNLTTRKCRSLDREGHGPATFSRDGKLLAFDDASAIRIWDIDKSQEVRRFESHPGRVTASTFSRDGKRLATVQEHEITVWDVATGKPLHAFPGHPGGGGFSGLFARRQNPCVRRR